MIAQGNESVTDSDIIAETVQPLLNDAKVQIASPLGQTKDAAKFENRSCINVA